MKNTSKYYLFRVLGNILLIASLMLALLSFSGALDLIWAFVAVIVSGGLYSASRSLTVNAKKKVAPQANDLLTEDKRAPVLYFRSFEADEITSRGVQGASLMGLEGYISEEEQLAEVMSDFGPFIAIGRPGEEIPTLGAARMYVTEGNWKKEVIKLIKNSFLVVIRIGSSSGLLWELKESIEKIELDKIILLIPDGEEDYIDFKASLEKIFGFEFPNYPTSKKDKFVPLGLRGFIEFDNNKPKFREFLQVGPTFRRSVGDKSLISIYKYAFKPIYERLGIAWFPPPLNWGGILMPVVVVIFIIILFLIGP